MLGVMYLDEALDAAQDEGLDVVLVSADADPPVCRLMDASKYKYELDKKDKEAKKKQRESRHVDSLCTCAISMLLPCNFSQFWAAQQSCQAHAA